MKIDLAVLALVLLFGGLGLFTGALRQVAHVAGLVAGWYAARPLALLAGPGIARELGYPLLLTTIGCSFVGFFLVYLLTYLLLRFALSRILPEGERSGLNRLGGFALGVAKGAVIAFVLLCGLAVLDKHIAARWDRWRTETTASIALSIARHHNLFASLPAVASLERLIQAGRDPKAAAAMSEDPELKSLARDPRMRTLLDDAGIRQALQEGDYAKLLSSARVLEVLNDPKLVERLSRLQRSLAAPGANPAGPSPESEEEISSPSGPRH
ncbi:MAG: CvpA family protein [Deltaproteobacteria bacterium]|nr:CvpA family protein [Deltaproteobacteria bacterium]